MNIITTRLGVNTNRLVVALVLGSVIPSARAAEELPIVGELAQSRSSLPPFSAEYINKIAVENSKARTKPNIEDWGANDGERTMLVSIDSRASSSWILPGKTISVQEKTFTPGDIRFFSDGVKHYTSSDGQKSGSFGTQQGVTMNPLSCAYEFFGDGWALNKDFEAGTVRQQGNDQIIFKRNDEEYVLHFKRFDNQQLVIEEIVGGGPPRYSYDLKVDKWIFSKGYYYPQVVTRSLTKNGTLSQTQTFTLSKLRLDEARPLTWAWKEGALVEDGDTGEVFDMHNGHLLLDPRFSKPTAELVTVKRGVFILCVLGLVSWVFLRIRRTERA